MNLEFLQLLDIHGSRGSGHQIVGPLRLREGDDVANRIRLSGEHRDSVHPESDASVRWRPILQGVEEEAELDRETVLDELRVGECMTPDPQCVSSSTPARDVADLLSLNKFGAMPVVDEGELVGMISYIDFLKHYAAER